MLPTGRLRSSLTRPVPYETHNPFSSSYVPSLVWRIIVSHSEKVNSGPGSDHQPRSLYITPHMIRTMMNHKFTTTDLLVVWTISDCMEIGLPISNEYLANATNRHIQTIRRSVDKLTKIGVVVATYQQGQRYLKLEWS